MLKIDVMYNQFDEGVIAKISDAYLKFKSNPCSDTACNLVKTYDNDEFTTAVFEYNRSLTWLRYVYQNLINLDDFAIEQKREFKKVYDRIIVGDRISDKELLEIKRFIIIGEVYEFYNACETHMANCIA